MQQGKKANTSQGREQKKDGGRTVAKSVRETIGESGIWETRIAQPQIGSFPGRMRKHTAEFLGKAGFSMNGLFVCQPLKQGGGQHMKHLQRQ